MGKEATIEEIQREVLEVELETKRLGLARAKRDNAQFESEDKRRRAANATRMTELADGRQHHYRIIQTCRHRAGGRPENILAGGGKNGHSLITRAIMPDGVTVLLQCSRCRLGSGSARFYTPRKEEARQLWFTKFDDEMAFFEMLLKQSVDDGIPDNILRGPTFMFQRNGVPFVPKRL